MILRRLGNKKKIAKEIIKHFPPHKIYIEPFFGAGGMFFNKPKSKYNIVNDLDSDVFNLFQVVMNQKEELEKAFYMMPIHSDLLEHWKKNEEVDPIKKALRFLLMSNFTYLGKGDSIRHSVSSGAGGGKDFKDKFNANIKKTFDFLYDVNFTNFDFTKFLNSLTFANDGRNDEAKTLIYNDPPYLETGDNYSNSFTKEDLMNLIEVNIETGCKFAISEFNNPVVLELAEQYNLEVITIGERQNLKNKRVEILMVNYQSPGKYGLFANQ
jgi:DNA adenine methylase